ncbi:MAG: beta-ketoacyl-[acyl-carrier-protein] synthase family protein [Epsilonproteobacteria bacterium]|nr:beta-ketoacyl-[acyl-carrier-protein] synthase family protein [Campylobacterota bacterium]
MNMQKNRAVYIDKTDLCCSAGLYKDELFQSIILGDTGIRYYEDYLIDGSTCAIGKIVSTGAFDTLMLNRVKSILESSDLDNFHNTFLVVGTSVGGMAWAEDKFIKTEGSYRDIVLEKQSIYSISHILNREFKFKDSITFSTACTSSSNAIVFAKELIENGAYDTVLVVGADSISYTTVNGFNALGVLSNNPCRPFDSSRDGMSVSEGIGVILLSSKTTDIKLLGVGCSSDAYNITHPHPEGKGAILAMQNALENAGISSKEIEYINTHGTGTIANDKAEGEAILELFSHNPWVSSTKSITGHTLGACGAIELIISAMVLQKGIVPKNFNLKNQELAELNLTKENISTDIEYVLSNAFAFGGNNVSIILQRVKSED